MAVVALSQKSSQSYRRAADKRHLSTAPQNSSKRAPKQSRQVVKAPVDAAPQLVPVLHFLGARAETFNGAKVLSRLSRARVEVAAFPDRPHACLDFRPRLGHLRASSVDCRDTIAPTFWCRVVDKIAPLTPAQRRLRKWFISVWIVLPLAMVLLWLISGTPFIFTYSRDFPSSAKLEQEPPTLILTVTNDTLRSCDSLDYSYDIVLTDGAVALGPSIIGGRDESLGKLGPYQTRTFKLPLADPDLGYVIVVPPTAASPARAMNPGELEGAKFSWARGYCVYRAITLD